MNLFLVHTRLPEDKERTDSFTWSSESYREKCHWILLCITNHERKRMPQDQESHQLKTNQRDVFNYIDRNVENIITGKAKVCYWWKKDSQLWQLICSKACFEWLKQYR